MRGDNKSVLSNISVPTSMLKKKSNSIAYHFVRKGTARDEWRFDYVKSCRYLGFVENRRSRQKEKGFNDFV